MNLLDNQKLALKNSLIKSKIHEKNLMYLITQKFIDNNINTDYINQIKNYINTYVSLTTKINCNILEQFIINPLLKNKLELNATSSYSAYRKTKEDKLFHNAYNLCNDSDRVKYGSLNLKNIISGDPLASYYGDTTIFYKNDVKDKTTFLYGNSSEEHMYICTFTYFLHILHHMPISDISILIDLINKIESKINFKSYIEIQLHGEINLKRDVEKITLSNITYLINKNIVDNFIKQYPEIQVIIY